VIGGAVINHVGEHFPGSELRYGPVTNDGTGSVLKYGQPVDHWRKKILEIFTNPCNLKRHILKSAFTEIPP